MEDTFPILLLSNAYQNNSSYLPFLLYVSELSFEQDCYWTFIYISLFYRLINLALAYLIDHLLIMNFDLCNVVMLCLVLAIRS
jgi:hypothetical protein